MCLIAVAIHAHPRWRFVLVGNRDEFHARPSAPAGPLDAAGTRWGGRDLQAGGGWLQVDARGRVAAVTNVRTGRAEPAPRSRGALVAGFIERGLSAADFLETTLPDATDFGPFNLLLWDGAAHFASNRPDTRSRPLASGLHALSNGDLDAPWPKTEALRARLADWIAEGDPRDPRTHDVAAPLFEALADPREAPDAALPSTGVPLNWERRLSAALIVGSDYGTRASSVVLVGEDGLWVEERRFGTEGRAEGRSAGWLPRVSSGP